VDELVEGVKGLEPAEGVEEVLVPGDPEAQTRQKREKMGIPLPPGTVQALEEVAGKLGLEALV
jgi:LDH2 family malate/lactate/ureidoglycolate dehydrogenase